MKNIKAIFIPIIFIGYGAGFGIIIAAISANILGMFANGIYVFCGAITGLIAYIIWTCIAINKDQK